MLVAFVASSIRASQKPTPIAATAAVGELAAVSRTAGRVRVTAYV